jgi:hypothetical protein
MKSWYLAPRHSRPSTAYSFFSRDALEEEEFAEHLYEQEAVLRRGTGTYLPLAVVGMEKLSQLPQRDKYREV